MSPAEARRRASRWREVPTDEARELFSTLIIVGAFMTWLAVTISAVLALFQ